MKRFWPILSLGFAITLLAGVSVRAQGTSLGLGVGVVDLENLGSTVWYTANLRLPLGGYLALEPEIGFFKKTETSGLVEASFEDLTYGANALLILPGRSIELFVGAGVGVHRIKGTLGLAGLIDEETTDTRVGVHFLGGLEFRLGENLGLFGALRRDTLRETDEALKFSLTKIYAGLRVGF